jgi:DNA-binding response OmpR family regulator
VRALVVARTALARRLLQAALPEGYELVFVDGVDAALQEIFSRPPELVVVESDALGVEGLEVCRELRAVRDTPIVLLADRKETEGVVRGLTCADEFIGLPVAPAEVASRMEAVLRRSENCRDEVNPGYDDGTLRVDLARRRVTILGREVFLTPTEYRLLSLLVRNRGRIVTQEELLERVWGQGYREDGHLLRMQIAHLRRKLAPAGIPYIVTYRGIGYAFKMPGEGDQRAALRSG